jgi:DNA-binding CsgD family transcriptional regulator
VELTGRHAECAVLDRFVEDVRAGESRALVVDGVAGVGKTALLEYTAEHATGCRVVRAAGVESEMELAFAGLHQLCAPILDRLDGLAVPQRDALRTALGMSAGPPPDLFLVGLAALSLVSDAAQERPFICLVDDQQWLDHASAQVLAFVARRLMSESVGVIIAARVPSRDLATLPELVVTPLRQAEARTLLDSVLPGPVDTRVRDQIVAETAGVPLALLELPRGLTSAQLAGGFGIPGAVPLERGIEENFRRRVGALPVETQELLLVASAEPVGDPALLWRAATRLAIEADAAAPAIEAGLAEFGTRVRFRHPLVRSAIYQSASIAGRQQAHRALAEVTDPQVDPDRRAWHRAQGSPGPDDDVAAELERSAGRAQARGGLAAAAAFLRRAAMLTLDPAQRARRALAAASAAIQAGGLETAPDLLAMAELGPLDEFERAQLDLVRALLAFNTNRGRDAPPPLLRAAARLEAIDVDLSRATYLDALNAAIFAGGLARPGGDVVDVANAARAAPPPQPRRPPDLLLDGLAALVLEGYPAAAPLLREAVSHFRAGMAAEEELRWLWLANVAALRCWDHDSWDVLSARHVDRVREAGALSELPLALTSRAYALIYAGEIAEAAALTDEIQAVKDATGSNIADYARLGLVAFRGDETGTWSTTEAFMSDVEERGEGIGKMLGEWLNALLYNSLGRYESAVAAAQRGTAYEADPGGTIWPAPELIEAGARCAMTDVATDAYRRFSEKTTASGTDWALGLEARSYALLCEGEQAEWLYREALARLGRTRVRTDLARAHLLYGEWLRRQRRRADAREQLRTAHRMFEAMGMDAFAERTRRELRATGETTHRRTVAARHTKLTAQEAQIARLARDGLTNPEIATRLFISPHTVQYHLRKVFTKLGVSSRSQLERALPQSPATGQRP